MVPTSGLVHLQITVADLERSVRFYAGVLGMKEMFRVEEDDFAAVMMRTPGCQDTFTINYGQNAHAGQMGGIAHYGFRLKDPADMDRAAALAEEHGGKVLRRLERDGLPVAFVQDPDGYKVELFCD